MFAGSRRNRIKNRKMRQSRQMANDQRSQRHAGKNFSNDARLSQALEEIAEKMGCGDKEKEEK